MGNNPVLGRFAQADSIIPLQTQGVQAWDRYAYVNNNPLRYTDPSGNWLETAFDIFSLGLTINDIRNEGFTVINTISLVTDVAAIVIPVVPAGASHVLRATKYTSKAVNAVDNVVDTAKILDNGIDATKIVDDIPDLFRNAGPDAKPNLGLKTPDNPYRDGTWDIAPDASGNVGPGSGGLSTHSIPKPDWNNPWMHPSDAPVPDGIRIFQDNPAKDPTHWLWEPAWKMPYNEFKQLLKKTVPSWIKIE